MNRCVGKRYAELGHSVMVLCKLEPFELSVPVRVFNLCRTKIWKFVNFQYIYRYSRHGYYTKSKFKILRNGFYKPVVTQRHMLAHMKKSFRYQVASICKTHGSLHLIQYIINTQKSIIKHISN